MAVTRAGLAILITLAGFGLITAGLALEFGPVALVAMGVVLAGVGLFALDVDRRP